MHLCSTINSKVPVFEHCVNWFLSRLTVDNVQTTAIAFEIFQLYSFSEQIQKLVHGRTVRNVTEKFFFFTLKKNHSNSIN